MPALAPAPDVADPSQEPHGPADGRVLVVDDDPLFLDAVCEQLAECFHVIPAASAREAREILRHDARRVGVVVCDQKMPGESGLELFKDTRHHYPTIQRLMLTGHSDRALVLAAINDGAVDGYLLKDEDIEQLEPRVEDALATWWRERASAAHRRHNRELVEALTSDDEVTRRAKAFTETVMSGLFTLSVGALFTAVLGVGVFVLLYVLKATLGVDMFAGFHLA